MQGLVDSMVGPTLLELSYMYHVTYEEMSRVIVFKSILILLGTVFAGAVRDYSPYKTDIFLGTALTVMAVATFAIPFGGSMLVLSFIYALQGFAYTHVNVCKYNFYIHL